jgi:transposase
MTYSTKFKQRMVAKLTGPDAWSAKALAKEVGVPQPTLSRWVREAKVPAMAKRDRGGSSGRRRRWTPEEKVRVVMEAVAQGEAEFGSFLRQEGLHEADLERFRVEVMEAATEGLHARGRRPGVSPEHKQLRKLEKELARKEKALAEAAALLVLRGKVEAFLSGDEEGDTDGKNEK